LSEKLSNFQVMTLIKNAVDSFPHQECETCECFLGYIAQLDLDSDGMSRDFIIQYKPDRKYVHSCLGCDPCPPGDRFAEYIKEHRENAN